MVKLKSIIILFISLMLSGCGYQSASDHEQIHGKDSGIPELNTTIHNYFLNFEDINKWSDYATDDFIKRVYSWCSGDTSESKSIIEMKSIYYEINKDSLKLKKYTIEDIEKVNESNVNIHVERTWEDGSQDQSSY